MSHLFLKLKNKAKRLLLDVDHEAMFILTLVAWIVILMKILLCEY